MLNSYEVHSRIFRLIVIEIGMRRCTHYELKSTLRIDFDLAYIHIRSFNQVVLYVYRECVRAYRIICAGSNNNNYHKDTNKNE